MRQRSGATKKSQHETGKIEFIAQRAGGEPFKIAARLEQVFAAALDRGVGRVHPLNISVFFRTPGDDR